MTVIGRMTAAVLLAVAAASGAAWGQQATIPGDVDGVRLSLAESSMAVGLVRWTMESYASDRALQQSPSRQALGVELEGRIKTKWPLAGDAPAAFAKPGKRQVFLTLYAPGGADLSAEGRGETLTAALLDATTSILRSGRYQMAGFNRLAEIRISLDVTQYRLPYLQNLAEPFLYSMRPGIDGLVYENGTQRGMVLPWEAVRRAWEIHLIKRGEETTEETRPALGAEDVKKAVFRSLLERAQAHPATWRDPAARVLRFEVQSFVESRPGGEAVELYRTGPLARPESLKSEDVRKAVALATDYLARTPGADGLVRAAYDPARDTWSDEPDAPRQALAIQALVRRWEARKEEWLRRGALQLADAMARALKEAPKVKGRDGAERDSLFVVSGTRAELNWTAQVLLASAALESVSPDDARKEQIRKLANTLIGGQKDDGSFNLYFGPGTDIRLMIKDEEDVAGESLMLLAMVRAYQTLKDEDLLRRSRQTADYLVFQREKHLGQASRKGVGDTYLVEALGLLDALLGNDEYVAYASLCTQQLVANQLLDASRFPLDELGGITGDGAYPDSQSTTFALRGLRSAQMLFDRIKAASAPRYGKLGLASVADVAGRAQQRAEAYLLGLQYGDANSFYIQNPVLAMGGLRFNACDARISTVSVANFVIADGGE